MVFAISIPISLFILSGVYARHIEKKKWNNGICDKCNNNWYHYDTDSQGGRMYKCVNGHSCNISYKVDK